MTLARAVIIAAIIALALSAGRAPFAQIIQGDAEVRVIDGDTLDVGGVRIRLFGVDAPESGQRCNDEQGRPYNCAALAASALEEEIAGGKVICNAMETDQFGRTVAICTVRGQDIGEAIVRRGYALDFARYSHGRYAVAEAEAREARRGMWAGAFVRPDVWRREKAR